ncbi:MAG: ABC transporter ATP-binding protein [Ectothiorhodospiraceae bacterium]|nr:ABC transporter ATP-binding protein [Chromatiales bacterium]MCP5154939.1 ABC transporter ATP-binding protein [Ectothiorhodospiraceae bacterium]
MTDEGRITAVDHVSFALERGQTLGIVGESGSGKSVATRAVIRLLTDNALVGERSAINLTRRDGRQVDILGLASGSSELRQIRGGEVSMIFQEPMASFSPLRTIGTHMVEALQLHERVSKAEATRRSIELLERVGIADAAGRFRQYSFELSGGMRQRAMIAMALVTRPSILIADEPTTALDVTIQAQILQLLRELQEEMGMAMIFISHDLGVIAQIARNVAVMYLGRVVEEGPTRDVIFEPRHPYTRGLIQAIPRLDAGQRRLTPIGGDIPSPLARPSGCPFHTRCGERLEGRCEARVPDPREVAPSHVVSCHLHD